MVVNEDGRGALDAERRRCPPISRHPAQVPREGTRPPLRLAAALPPTWSTRAGEAIVARRDHAAAVVARK